MLETKTDYCGTEQLLLDDMSNRGRGQNSCVPWLLCC